MVGVELVVVVGATTVVVCAVDEPPAYWTTRPGALVDSRLSNATDRLDGFVSAKSNVPFPGTAAVTSRLYQPPATIGPDDVITFASGAGAFWEVIAPSLQLWSWTARTSTPEGRSLVACTLRIAFVTGPEMEVTVNRR